MRENTPPDKEFSLGDMGTCFAKNRGGLRLVDISRTPGSTFFKGAPYLGNGMPKWSNRDVLWRFVTNSARGRPASYLPAAVQALLGPAASPVARFDGVVGADWPTWPQARLALASLASIDG